MGNGTKVLLGLLVIGMAGAIIWWSQDFLAVQPVNDPVTYEKRSGEEEEEGGLSKYDRMDLAIAQEVEMTKDPALGYVPRERLMAAIQQVERTANNRSAIPGVEWIERGPNDVGGRTRAVIFDPNDPTNKKVFAGCVSGGLWVCDDITQPNPGWRPINDLFANLAVTTIAYDPNNTQTMYFGTGEGFFNADAVMGDGIWKSTDGGVTWSQLSSTKTNDISSCSGAGNCDFLYVQKIVVTENSTVLAACRSRYTNRGGLMRSTDGGNTWSRVLTGSSFYRVADIEEAANGDLYASVGIFHTDGIYKSTDDGLSWTQLTGGGLPSSDYERIELACAPSDSNTVLAVMHEAVSINSNDCKGLYLSTDGGNNWSTLTMPVYYANGVTDFTRGQAWYDLIAAFDPNDANRIFVGGIDIHLSEDQGSTWSNIGEWRGRDHQYVHADQHAIYFLPGSSSEMLLGTDGGVYYSDNADSSMPTIKWRNYGYNTVQYYAGDLSPTAHETYFIGGTQDNGSHRLKNIGISPSVEVTGGDGGFSHVNQNDPSEVFTTFTRSNYNYSSDSGKSFSGVPVLSGNSSNGRFINPTDYDDDSRILYGADDPGRFHRVNPPYNATSDWDYINASWSGQVSTVTVDPNNSNTVWFGTGSSEVYKVTNAHTSSPTFTNYSSSSQWSNDRFVSSITLDPSDGNHILVTFSNYGVPSVFESTDGGATWTNLDNTSLPDMPIRDALFNPNNGDEVLLATEAGVWSTDNLNGSSTNWAATNTGMATVRTDQLKYRDSDGLVLALTHGRGMYTSDIFTSARADFGSDRTVVYIGQEVQFFDNSYQANSYSWDFGDGNTSTQQNPTHTYSEAGDYTIVLTINGSITESKTDYIRVLPNRTVPYKNHFGGNMEVNLADFGGENIEGLTPFELGNSSVSGKNGTNSGSNAWVTGETESSYDNHTVTNLYSPNFDFSASGTYTLNFSIRHNTELDWDGLQVQYTLDRGENWNILADGDPVYNSDDLGYNSAFLNGEPFISGNNGSWQNESIGVSNLSGESDVAFRFVFKADQAITDVGLALDDIYVNGPSTANDGQVVISQYRDGTNKGLELWNISDQDIDLSKTPIQLYRYDNGSTTPTLEVELTSGIFAAGDVAVIGNSSLQTYMTTYHPTVPFTLHSFSFDGDDAIEVVWDGYRNDVLGEIGVDPGSGWSGSGVSTNNQHLVLQPQIFAADTNGWSDPSVRFREKTTGTTWSEFGLPPASVYTQSAWIYSAPDANSDSINFHLLDGSFAHSGDLGMQHLYVSNPATFTLNSGTLTLTGDFENQSTPVVIEENASLLMTDDNATVTGDITTKRTGTQYSNIFNYWSTPVSGVTYNDVWNNFSGFNSGDLYLFDGSGQQWTSPTTGSNIPIGRGIAMTGLIAGGTNQRQFTGTPNNGDINVTVHNTGGAGGDNDYNLIGNPYPSAVDAIAFLTDPDNSELVGSIWYWDRDLTGSHSTVDYAQWTLTGGLCPSGCSGATGSLVPDQYIPAMQGFMSETDNAGDGTVVFKNSHRVAGNNNKFFKQAPVDRMWLSARHESGPANGILIGFTPDATNDYDRMYDGRKLSGNADISFYTLLDDEPFAIQGRSNQATRHVIPLGLRAGRVGQYTIQLDTMDNISALTQVHLEHIPTGARYDLRKGGYTLTVQDAGTVITDYQLVINGTITSQRPADIPTIQYIRGQQEMVLWLNQSTPIDQLEVYDVQGRLIYRSQSANLSRLVVPMQQQASGIYFVHVTAEGSTYTRKVFY